MNESTLRSVLGERLQAVEARLTAACQRVGRPRGDVTLVAVTKTIPEAVAALLPELGLLDLGENRPQELWRKAAALPTNVRWHLIGHLQRNKVERTLPLIHLMHSVDSPRLLEALEKEAERRGASLDVLLEVNASREASKGGFAPDDVLQLPEPLARLKFVHVRGLMTMAAPEDDPERCRPTFAELRTLRDQLANNLGAPHDLRHLSMGMSNDFEIAVEEGATLVRLGSVLFEGLS
ncbi:MAG: YggS family pyridoxal phosphate-dependent enzyme [Planctomycetia bacterium]|nr:YggS family pyridoxal phosphate-dependent enzyme [Planctomycetia bacterium]